MTRMFFIHCNDCHNSRGMVISSHLNHAVDEHIDGNLINDMIDDIVERFGRTAYTSSQCTITVFDVTDMNWKPDAMIGSELADNIKTEIRRKPVLEQMRTIEVIAK